jgi:hypothetical protein
MNKGAVYGVLFATVAILLVGYVCWKLGLVKSPVERFDAAQDVVDGGDIPPLAASVQEGTYESQMAVIRTFESHVGRKPTVEELKKYSVLLEEDNIVAAIKKDFGDKRGNGGGGGGGGDEQCDADTDADTTDADTDDDDEDDGRKNKGGGTDSSDDEYCSSDDETPSAWPPRKKPTKPEKPAKHPKASKTAAKHVKPVETARSSSHQRCKPMAQTPKGIICVDRSDLLSRLKAISNEVDCFYDMLRLMK